MKTFYLLCCTLTVLSSCKNNSSKETVTGKTLVTQAVPQEADINVIPISHATMVLKWDGTTIYIDPVGGAEAFKDQPDPDLILITDIHGDHFNLATLEALNTSKAKIMVPQAVADRLPDVFAPQIDVLNNGSAKERFGFNVTAIPMYNLREEALKFHTKGRGNGYVIEKGDTRIYCSGDTEDIPEMRALQNINMAFVCMNLPYTMTVEKAADAVLEFKPAKVYPYHYRGTEGLSDVKRFKKLVNTGDSNIEVVQLNWYQ